MNTLLISYIVQQWKKNDRGYFWHFEGLQRMTDNQPKKPDLGLLEEDDEFEEFPAEG